MNRYFLLYRLTGPAILVLLGVVALLHQAHLVRFTIFGPLVLILIGVIKLAQRAVMATEPMPPAGPYAGYPQAPYPPYPGAPYPPQPYAGVPAQGPVASSAAPTHDFGNDPEGGKQ